MNNKMSKNIIWRTNDDPEKAGEYATTQNIEVRHKDSGIEIRVIKSSLRDDPVSLSKILTSYEADQLGAAIVKAAKSQVH